MSFDFVSRRALGSWRRAFRFTTSACGMQIWIPRADRTAVLAEWHGDHPPALERLPLNYDDTTLRTIEQIDVLWLRGRAIKRAFEVEHTIRNFVAQFSLCSIEGLSLSLIHI